MRGHPPTAGPDRFAIGPDFKPLIRRTCVRRTRTRFGRKRSGPSALLAGCILAALPIRATAPDFTPRPARAVIVAPVAAGAPVTAIKLHDVGQWIAPAPVWPSIPVLQLAAGAAAELPTARLWETRATARLTENFSPLISDAASRTGLPYDFLYRLLRRESGLRADAVSPKGALGIAQFMPATALERGLIDPFDPSQAVIKAAELLRDHKTRFGNLGLAAAAYNAGPGRVERWLAGTSGMPQETRDYVLILTGRAVETWAPAGQWASLQRSPGSADKSAPVPVSSPTDLESPVFGKELDKALWKARSVDPVRAAKSGTNVHRREMVARSEDELCSLIGRDGSGCTVRRTY